MASCGFSVHDCMAEAIRRRDELDVFIRLLTNKLQGRDLVEDAAAQDKAHSREQHHSG